LTAATCLICCAKVRTPLNSPLLGAKSYLSSGMASAAGTSSLSMILTPPSSTWLMVFFSSLACARPKLHRTNNVPKTAVIVFIFPPSKVRCRINLELPPEPVPVHSPCCDGHGVRILPAPAPPLPRRAHPEPQSFLPARPRASLPPPCLPATPADRVRKYRPND